MQNSIPEDDWVAAEAAALLDSTPGLREDLRRGIAQHRSGKSKTVDTATVRRALEERIKAKDSG